MIFPIGDDQVQRGFTPYFSYIIIVLNCLVFFYQISLPVDYANAFVFTFGSIPVELLAGEDLYTVFTSMFLHGSWMHLIGNMLFMWVFADNIESTIGSRRFLIFFLLGGLGATLTHALMLPYSQVPCVGASGAISAILGAYLILFPASRIKVLFFLFTFRVPAFLFLGIWIFQQYSSGIDSLKLENIDTTTVAWWAHIGGVAFGLVAGIYFRKFKPVANFVDESDEF
jgi:membrane associated rhomboid family serine protease